LRDVLRLFTPSELDQGRQAAGIVDHHHSAKSGIRTIAAQQVLARGGLRTVNAKKEVGAWRR
jgi:hypothetical protein